jgi:hypothetical protein
MELEKDTDIKTQSIGTVTISSILVHIIHSIFGFIAIYFFQPIWHKFIKWWDNDSKIN